MANKSGQSKRAALRRQQEMAAAADRRRKIIMGGVGALAILVLVVVAVVVIQLVGREAEVTADQLRPPHATEADGLAIVSEDVQPFGEVPHLIIWQDYQCPLCGIIESYYGPAVEELVDSGEITVELRTAFFLDNNNPGDASKRASMAVAAADEVDFLREYHRVIYDYQEEGYSNQALREQIPSQIGMPPEAIQRFQELYDDRAFNDFADAGNQAFNNSPWTGTPTYEVNGQQIAFRDTDTGEFIIDTTPEAMLEAIQELAGN